MKESAPEPPGGAWATTDGLAATASVAEQRDIDLQGRTLRGHAAGGMVVNTAFTVGMATLTLLRGLVVTAFLTPDDYGVWGIVAIALGTLTWLKQVGFSEKYVQQDEADQEAAFQKAFTLELVANTVLMVALLAAIPLAVAVYGQHRIVGPAFATVAIVPAMALQTPIWIFYRRMDFVRQRTLQAIDPAVSMVVAIVLAASGAGVWALVGSMLAGAWASAIAIWLRSPYRLALRWDRATVREYLHFSWPLFASGIALLLMAQATVITASHVLGLAGVGALTIATTFSSYTHRVDEVVTATLYPAICAVKDRLDVLAETFVKSNRLTLMWGMPFGVGLALFTPDIVHFAIGRRWDFAILAIQATAIGSAMQHIAFNWTAFHRARNETGPIAVSTWIALASYAAGPIPLLIADGLRGYSIGIVAASLVQLAVRGHYMRRMLAGFGIVRHTLRAVAPTLPALAVVLLARLAEPRIRTEGWAVAELAAYLVVTAAATWLYERDLLREVLGYLRPGRAATA
jgi:O-antigen/teichoic acid export membrane protein